MSNRPSRYSRAALAGAVLLTCAQARAQIATLDKGHNLLLNSGLQIWGCDTGASSFTYSNLTGANMNGVMWSFGAANAGALSTGQRWGKWVSVADNNVYVSPTTALNATEQAHYADLFAIQAADEQQSDIENPTGFTKQWFDEVHANNMFTDKLLYVNSAYTIDSNAYINFVANSDPDAISWDSYPFGTTGVYPYNWLGKAQYFRRVALGSAIGAHGAHARPYGLYLQTYHGGDGARDPGDLEMRWQQFTAWTLGYTFVDCFTVGGGTSLFIGGSMANPLQPNYNNFKESARQSKNLGPALTRLISYGYGPQIIQGKDPSGATNAVPIDWLTFNKTNAPPNQQYLTGVSAVNTGTKNNGNPGDVYVGFFNPLLTSFGNPAGEAYFMLTNALGAYLQDATATVADCQQAITTSYDFAQSGITTLQRLRRSDGLVEVVPLTVTGQNLYSMTYTLEGGTGDLYKFNDGTPFIGAPAIAGMYWDNDGSSAGNNTTTGANTGGTGSWTSAGKWYDGAANGSWVGSRDATFWGAAGTVTVASPQTVNGLSFKTNGYSLTGSTVTLNTGAINTDAGVTATISSTLSGVAGVWKNGSGTLKLTGSNTYSNGTFINGGVVQINSDAALGTAPSLLTSNILLNGGTLQWAATFDLASTRGITVTAAGGTLDTNGFGNTVGYPGTNAIQGPGNLTKTGDGTFFSAATAVNTLWTGNLILKQGTWKINAPGGLPVNPTTGGARPGQVTFDGGTLQFAAAMFGSQPNRGWSVSAGGGTIDTQGFNVTWAGPITGSAGSATLTKAGSGTLRLNSSATASNYNGALVITAGMLSLDGGAAMGDQSSVSLNNTSGALLNITGGETIGSLAGGGTFGGNVALANVTFNVGGNNSTTTYAGVISGAGSLTKSGSGTMLMNGVNTYAGSTIVTAGKLAYGASSTTSSALTVNSGATVQLIPSGSTVLRAPAITVNGKIDLGDNKLITQSAVGTWNGSAYTGVTGLVIAGRNGGAWNGTTGILTSMTAASGATSLTTIAIAANSILGKSTFASQTVGGSDVLLMYTYAGDADLNGSINGDDYFRIDNGYSSHLTAYVNGDFNYDGKINADDYFLIDVNYSRQTTSYSSAPPAGVESVPEPTGVAVVACGAIAFLAQRRKRRTSCPSPSFQV